MATAVAAAFAAACGTGLELGVADGPPGRCGQSASQIRFRPETMLSLVFYQSCLRTVRYREANGPPLMLEVCPETMSSLEVRKSKLRTVHHLGADSPQ